jgi:hypothetical protein
MRLSLRRWRPRHLLLSWVAYWIALVAVRLGGAIMAIRHVTSLPKGRGSFSLTFDDVFSLKVIDSGRTVWSGSAAFGEVVLWFAGPPLLLFVLWLLARPRRGEVTDAEAAHAALGEGPYAGVARADPLERDATRAGRRTP